jgi:hypothetical protein
VRLVVSVESRTRNIWQIDIAFGRITVLAKYRVDGLGELIIVRFANTACVYPEVLYAIPPCFFLTEQDLVITSLALTSTIHQASERHLLRIRPPCV